MDTPTLEQLGYLWSQNRLPGRDEPQEELTEERIAREIRDDVLRRSEADREYLRSVRVPLIDDD